MFQMPSAALPQAAAETSKPAGLSAEMKKKMGAMLAQQALGSVQGMARPPMMTKTQAQFDQYGNPLGMLGY